jgi:hypothetical protein
MKKLPTLLLILSCAALIACGKGQSISGHSVKTAYKSVKFIKEKLPPENRMEFQVSFWTIRDANKDDEAFLDAVDGKSPIEIVATAKEIYQQRKASGFQAYDKYSSWEEMISEFGKERVGQDKRRTTPKKDEGGGQDDNVLYKLQ